MALTDLTTVDLLAIVSRGGIRSITVKAKRNDLGVKSDSVSSNSVNYQGTAMMISFTVSTAVNGGYISSIYQAEQGMTLGEWVESEYNTDGFYIADGRVYNSSGTLITDGSLSQSANTSFEIYNNTIYYAGGVTPTPIPIPIIIG